MSRQGALVLGVALLLFVAVGASAQQGVFDSSDEKLADHEQRLAALEEAVFGDEESTATGAGPTTTTVPKVAPESPATSVVTTTTTTPEPVAQSRATPTTTTTTGAAEEKPATSGGETHLVIESDTTINEKLVLRPGDSIEFRNGARLSFGPGGSADWQGTKTSTWSDDGRTQNLDRDILIHGEGDIMFMPGSKPGVIRFIEIDLQPKQELAHYPLHWHHAGDSPRGTLIEGVVIKNSTNRAFVTHGSNGITIRDSIATNTIGEAFWWDLTTREERQAGRHPSASSDIVWDHNLADGVFDTPLKNNVRLAAFTMGDGRNNVLRNSVARNVQSNRNKDCAGFTWPEGIGSVWVFENNAAIGGNCNGIFVWQNSSGDHVISNFRAVGVGKAGIRHGAYGNNYRYIDVDVDSVVLLAGEKDSIGPRFVGGRIGDVTFLEHRLSGVVRFENVEVDSVRINNDRLGCDRFVGGDYTLIGTGLSFADVDGTNACPGTVMNLDGESRDFG